MHVLWKQAKQKVEDFFILPSVTVQQWHGVIRGKSKHLPSWNKIVDNSLYTYSIVHECNTSYVLFVAVSIVHWWLVYLVSTSRAGITLRIWRQFRQLNVTPKNWAFGSDESYLDILGSHTNSYKPVRIKKIQLLGLMRAIWTYLVVMSSPHIGNYCHGRLKVLYKLFLSVPDLKAWQIYKFI